MPAITSAPSAICGTHFGDTNEAASTLRKPAADRRLISSILIAVGDEFLFVLQSVTRTDFDDFDLLG